MASSYFGSQGRAIDEGYVAVTSDYHGCGGLVLSTLVGHRCWGDYTSDDSRCVSMEGGNSLVEFGEENSIVEADPIMMLPPCHHSGWVAEVKR